MITISEIIKELECIRECYGDDLECYVATDEEGNSFMPVVYLPSIVLHGNGEILLLN